MYNHFYMQNQIKIVVLAAGKGKRIGSDIPKVLIPLHGRGLVEHILDTIKKYTDEKPILVVGHMADMVKAKLGDTCEYALQAEQLGTGHAIACAEGVAKDAEHILILQGDMPLITDTTIKNLINRHISTGATITFATTKVPDFTDWYSAFNSFGRIEREGDQVFGIKEYKDASEAERAITEVNAGSYVFRANWLWENLKKIKNENAQKEYYLTDLFHIAFEEGEKIETVHIDPHEALGANTKEELEILEKLTSS